MAEPEHVDLDALKRTAGPGPKLAALCCGHRHSRHRWYWSSFVTICRETVSDYSWHILSYPDFLQALGIRSLCGWLLLSTTGCTNSCESDPFGALRGPALWELWLTKLGWLTRYISGYDNRIHVPCKWKIYTSILLMISFTTFISSWNFWRPPCWTPIPFQLIEVSSMSQCDPTQSMKGDLVANPFSVQTRWMILWSVHIVREAETDITSKISIVENHIWTISMIWNLCITIQYNSYNSNIGYII